MLQNNYFIKKNCDQITLFTSESCNLNCAYCDMATHIDKMKHLEEAKKVKASLVNGEYLQTIKSTFERLEINPAQIKGVELWGQEPTLTMHELCTFFPQFYLYCNNINTLFFSTNVVSNVDKIIEFVLMLKETVDKKFTLSIQFSYDGKDFTRESRGIDPNIIVNNIRRCTKLLNELDLGPHLDIILTIHNVISDKIITKYSNPDNNAELYDFLKEFHDLSAELMLASYNKSIRFLQASPGILTPFNATAEDGKNLCQFYKNCEEVGADLKFDNWKGLPRQIFSRAESYDKEKVYQFLSQCAEIYKISPEDLQFFSTGLNCGFNTFSLKVRYDGILLHCQNALLGLKDEELQDKTTHDHLIQYRKVKKGFYPNILTDSDEVIDNYLYQCNLMSNASYPAAFAQISNLLMTLLYAGQVDKKYEDRFEFLKCVYYLSFSASCPHNAMMQTGTLYSKYSGWLRLLCNGFMDIVDEEYQHYLKAKQTEDILYNDS